MQVFADFFQFLKATPALVGLLVTAVVIFLTSNWRLALGALLVQFLLAALVLSRTIRVEITLVKAAVGSLVAVILYLSARHMPGDRQGRDLDEGGPQLLGFHLGWLQGPLGFPLRLLAVGLAILAEVRLFGNYRLSVVPMDVALLAAWLGAMGVLGLVLSGEPFRVATAVFTFLAAFDMVYGGLEESLAMTGFLSAFYLLTALAFAYLISVHSLAIAQERTAGSRPVHDSKEGGP